MQEFYDWYVSRDVLDEKLPTGEPTSNDVLRLHPKLLNAELQRLLREDSEAQSKEPGYVVGLDMDPFFNSQDPSPKFEVESARVNHAHCDAVVYGVDEGAKREKVMPELAESGPTWVFVNFHYESQNPQDESLISILKMLQNNRMHSGKR